MTKYLNNRNTETTSRILSQISWGRLWTVTLLSNKDLALGRI